MSASRNLGDDHVKFFGAIVVAACAVHTTLACMPPTPSAPYSTIARLGGRIADVWQQPATTTSLQDAGTTWQLACAGCPALTITLWRDREFWMREGKKGSGAKIFHGRWTSSDSTSASHRLMLFDDADDAPLFVLERKSDTMRLVTTNAAWRFLMKSPVKVSRVKSVDLIDDETTFTGVWNGNVHFMPSWVDCRDGQSVVVDGKLGPGPYTTDSAFVMRGRYHHEFARSLPMPPEWGLQRTSKTVMRLRHSFQAEQFIGRRVRQACGNK